MVPVTETGDRESVPAFGIALYEAFQRQRSPTKPSGLERGTASILVNYVGDGTINAFPTVPMSAVWDAIEHHESDRLTEWFNGKVVVFLPNPIAGEGSLVPTGQTVTNSVVHLHVLNMLLTDNQIWQLGAAGRSMMTLFLAGLVAWLLLRFRSTVSLLFAGKAIAIYGICLYLALAMAHIVLPLVLPMTAALLVLVGTTIGTHLPAHRRLRL